MTSGQAKPDPVKCDRDLLRISFVFAALSAFTVFLSALVLAIWLFRRRGYDIVVEAAYNRLAALAMMVPAIWVLGLLMPDPITKGVTIFGLYVWYGVMLIRLHERFLTARPEPH